MSPNKNKTLFLAFYIIAIVSIIGIVGFTYGYFNAIVENGENQKLTATAASMSLVYSEDNSSDISETLTPGTSVTKTFSVENTGTLDLTYGLYFKTLLNTFVDDELEYIVKDTTNDRVVVTRRAVPYEDTETSDVLMRDNITIRAGTKINYVMTVTFKDIKKGNNQANANAKYKFSVNIKNGTDPKPLFRNTTANNIYSLYNETYNDNVFRNNTNAIGDYKNIKKNQISTITTLSTREVPTDGTVVASWDASAQNNNSVMAWLTLSDTIKVKGTYSNTTKYYDSVEACETAISSQEDYSCTEIQMYNLYLGQDGGVVAPGNCWDLFFGYTSTTSINLDNLDTSRTTSFAGMFLNDTKLINLDISYMDTSHATDMQGMFKGISSLTHLNLEKFITSKVINMNGMFYQCSKITQLDLSNFDTSKVTNISNMFRFDYALKTLDVSHFDTSSVTDMSWAFHSLTSLEELDVSNWNTSRVTNMNELFHAARKIEKLDVSNWDTSNVTSMACTFAELTNLKSIDLSGWNTSKVTNMREMFSADKSLVYLDLSSFDTSKVTNMQSIFTQMTSLKEINLTNWNTQNVTNMSGMFNSDYSLKKLDLSSFYILEKADISMILLSTSGIDEIKTPNTILYTKENAPFKKTLYSKDGTAYTKLDVNTPTSTWLKTKEAWAKEGIVIN